MISVQPDLFNSPLLPGLAQADDVVTPDEERALVAAIDAVDLSPFRFQGWTGKRLTASFGWRYDFDGGGFDLADSIPDWLLPVRHRAARFAGLRPSELVQALLIRYDPGAGIGWHRDRPLFEHVVGVSLGAPATMRFRRRRSENAIAGFDRRSALLAPRSIYHLSGEARNEWEHSIAAMAATRWSITFRSLSAAGRRHIMMVESTLS
ncbi:alpha-ketoglutarate-dependent dioxygenase AlkB [Roseiarcaceae bacterium H3SJ34-1]|uniref:alpha-ketoglutarate-dependent dioxygenase AlkB n=1 Tax=Terripilifer ovatus TaxID=3032367 RepID=UPI003AB97C8C|nr:alpha-ketoglutarate-dependent dioxygenase AlkB [Roseiarcaceae bacterium H3SJ34-1]